MILNKNLITGFFLFFLAKTGLSQSQPTDSTKVESLEEVVITGQHNPQSVKNSIFEVTVINRRRIEQQAANNLSDLLNQTLNINITPNASNGKSGVSLFGLGSQYFKVLIDNIPIINEEGLGNNTDLTLINLDDIEQIEIVEGSMGVQYGSNAVSGIINVITKKSSRYKTQIKTYAQEEMVGGEYEWFDKGRHIQSAQIRHNFTENIFGSAAFTRNDFAGYWGDKQGKIYDVNDSLRGHDWLPKLQKNAKILLNYKERNFNMFYKFDYFNETIDKYSSIVSLNENPATDTSDPTALDEIYTNNRYYHHLNANGLLNKTINYNISLSYQEQNKDIEQYTYRIRKDQKLNVQEAEYLSRKALFSKGTFSNIVNSNKVKLQAGYELTAEKGYGSPLAITVAPDENQVGQKLNNYDFFTSTEINFNERFSMRPGARVSFSNLFKNQYVFSLGSKYQFNNDYELRTILGSANRSPSYDELYTYFVDVNHDVQGNPNLNPEKGLSAFVHLKKQTATANNLLLKNRISLSYLDVKDRIELVIVNQSPLAYRYSNIDRYKSINFSLDNSWAYKHFNGQLGVSVLGISKILNSNTTSSDDFLFSLQLNSNLNYIIPQWNTSFSLYFKHVGKQHQFVERTNEAGNQEFQKGTTDAFSWLDLTAKKTFCNNTFETTWGIKNLLDVTSVNTSAFSGGAHDAPTSSLLLGYGRSFFLKLAYNLNM